MSQYDRWSRFLARSGFSTPTPAPPSLARFAAALTGLPVAALGVGVNLLPYRLCDVIVKRIKKYDAAAAATYKVVWSLALFPAAWLVEALLVGLWLGWAAAAGFALLVVPLS